MSPKRDMRRDNSMTTALGHAAHRKVSSADLLHINAKAHEKTKKSTSGPDSAEPQQRPSLPEGEQLARMDAHIQTEVQRLVKVRVAEVTEQLMKAMEKQMVAMLERQKKELTKGQIIED